jgi:hypothetical protein
MPKCKVQSAKCKVQSAKCKVQSAKCKVQSAKCKVQSTKCKVQSAKCKVHMWQLCVLPYAPFQFCYLYSVSADNLDMRRVVDRLFIIKCKSVCKEFGDFLQSRNLKNVRVSKSVSKCSNIKHKRCHLLSPPKLLNQYMLAQNICTFRTIQVTRLATGYVGYTLQWQCH